MGNCIAQEDSVRPIEWTLAIRQSHHQLHQSRTTGVVARLGYFQHVVGRNTNRTSREKRRDDGLTFGIIKQSIDGARIEAVDHSKATSVRPNFTLTMRVNDASD